MGLPSITVAVQCHNFQRRLSWMLSSLVDQNFRDKYELVFDLAYVAEESDPKMSDILSTFRKDGIKIKDRKYDGFDRFQFRGFVRNDQLKDCKTDMMLFSDADMVYHPDFIYSIVKLLTLDPEYKDYPGVLMAGRYSNPIEPTNELVDSKDYKFNTYVDNAWAEADKLDKVKRRSVGAGYFQLINTKKCNHGGLYVDEKSCRDWGWYDGKRNMQKARSDQQFRRRVREKKHMPKWFHSHQIHLNHFRDNTHGGGGHLETQR